ncbi:MAG: DUF4189 domain-containing protein [Prosthecobacter sp.]
MKRLLSCWPLRFLVVLLLLGVVRHAPAAPPRDTYYAAIAYAERTKKWGYSEKHTNKEEAFKQARKACGGGDAKVVVWSSNGAYCALATSPNGSYGCATGATEMEARKAAHAECRKFGKNSMVVVCVRGGP